MKILANWIRDFVTISDDDRRLAERLTESGVAVEGFYNDGHDLAYEAEITTNRPDAMNHYGVARDASAVYDVDLKPITPKFSEKKGPDFPILIEDAEGCARYTARVVRGVKIAPSPANIARRLELIDQRPINNVADASNYTLNEMGHPTHAFDLDTLEGDKIVVRRARAGETIETLDGETRKLSPEDLVIADAVKPVAIAGVMGGHDTMITDRTRNVLIESAWFDPASVRRTSKRLGMHTDASHRFERGADYGATPLACARVAELIVQTAGGQVEQEIDAVAAKVPRPELTMHVSEVKRHLGTDIPSQEIARILTKLGFGIKTTSDNTFAVQVPTWRLDVDREIDLIEEVARIYGYNKFPNTLPAFAGAVVELPNARKQARLRQTLLALGYNETLSSTFIPIDEGKQFGAPNAVRLENPLSEEAAYMRTSLLPGLVDQVGYNLNRGNSDVRLFEQGHIFESSGDKVDERSSVAFVATGTAEPFSVEKKARTYSFFDIKGDIEDLVGQFEAKNVYFDSHTTPWLHPGRSARVVVDGTTVARFGQLHPELAAERKLKQEVYVGEILLERLYQRGLREPHYKPIPRFPAVERDFSFVFDDKVVFERMRAAVEGLEIAELQSFQPAEIFRGGKLAAGTYSVLLRAEFQAPDRTLTDDQVAGWSQRVIETLTKLGGTLRA
ncbi:MAG: phenylalanine--tRNA ligase subunit beta [Terriglobia bacterium]|nr:phenylalanine--tRNA ligase subunit beta [Terriglobia bacterium]